MNFFNNEAVAQVRADYPPNTRIELIALDDPFSKLKPGDRGTVDFVDDTASVHCRFDSGSTLGLLYGIDSYRKLTRSELIKEQARTVADTGRTNMFDVRAVFEIAAEMDCDELMDFLFMQTKEWGAFVLTGDLPNGIDTEEII